MTRSRLVVGNWKMNPPTIAEAVALSELLIFEDEGHGVATLANQVTANSKILEFLAAHLL